MSFRSRIRGVLPLVIVCVLAAPAGVAEAYQVTVNVHGAGRIDETTPAGLLDCTTPVGISDMAVNQCIGGSLSGPYDWGWTVTLQASVPAEYAARGWQFLKWVDSGAGGKVNCDPQGTTGDHTSASCTFATYENLSVEAYFDDVAGPQDTSITSGPSGTTNSTNASLEFDSGDPDASYQCRLDRPGLAGAWATCGTPSDKAEAYSGLTTNGTYTFSARGMDPSGNLDATPATRTWTVDTVGPTASIGSGPANGSRTSSTVASFGLSAGESVTYECRLDRPETPGAWSACSSTPSYSGLTDGIHTFSARARDAAGNIGPVVGRSWTVDTQPPNTSITLGPSGPTPSKSPTFWFTSSEPGSTFQCRLDTGPWESCAGSKSYTSLTDGAHTFSVRATDQVGLVDPTPATRSWTIDSVAPETSITSGPTGETNSTAAAFEFGADEAASFQCKLDGGAWEACASGKAYSGLAAGPHTFLVRAIDAAGNVDQSEAVRSWTVTVPPSGGTPGGDTQTGGTQTGGTQTGGAEPGGTQPAATLDTDAPVAVISFAKQRLARILAKGFVSSASTTEAGRLRLDLLYRGKVVATSGNRAVAGPGSTRLVARFTSRAKRSLGRLRTVKLTVRLTATDAAGNVSRKTRTATLRR